MTTAPHHDPEEVARLGSEVLTRCVLPALLPADDGKFVAVDVSTGEYELDADDDTAVTRLRGRRPDAEIWLARVGAPAAYLLR